MPDCSICNHPCREAIDAALREGAPSLRQLGATHGVSHSSLQRHKDSHTMTQTRTDTAILPTDAPVAPDWQALMEEAHQLVIEGDCATNDQRTRLLCHNLAKFAAHLTQAVAYLAGASMPPMPRLTPLLFRSNMEMPLDESWKREVWP